jgi:hypothetical protein
MDFGAIIESIGRFLQETQLPKQVKNVDYMGLFTNPWFLVPFVPGVGYLLYKQAFRDLIIMGIIMGVWYVSGTPYMQTLVVGDELKVAKILPVLFGGAGVLGVIIYLLLGRSD